MGAGQAGAWVALGCAQVEHGMESWPSGRLRQLLPLHVPPAVMVGHVPLDLCWGWSWGQSNQSPVAHPGVQHGRDGAGGHVHSPPGSPTVHTVVGAALPHL